MSRCGKGEKASRGKVVSCAEFSKLWHNPRLTQTDIAKILGVTQTAVSQRAMARGLGSRHFHRRAIKIDDAAFIEMWRSGVRTNCIAAALKTSKPTVRRHASLLGLEPRTRLFRGMTMDDYQALRLARFMASAARIEQAAFIAAELVDKGRDNRLVGSRQARGLM